MAAAAVMKDAQLGDRAFAPEVNEDDEEIYGVFVNLNGALMDILGFDLLDLTRTYSIREVAEWLHLLEVLREQGYSCDEVMPSLNAMRNIRTKQALYQQQHKDEMRKRSAAWMRKHRASLHGEEEKQFKKNRAEYMRQYRARKKLVLDEKTGTDVGPKYPQNVKSVPPGANEENETKT